MGGRGDGWVAGFYKTITSSASARARDEARAELGKKGPKEGFRSISW